MFRGFRQDVPSWSARFISIGGRRARGGFSRPLGKHPQVKQGMTEGVPRRIPGTTKVTYTNKKGRTFIFSVPVAEITHPQVNLTNASGSWREIDTSFSDVGDLEDDMPSPVDEYLRVEPNACSVSALIESFVSFCKEYVLMDTSGMKNMPFYGELNVGPDYEQYDRRLKRRRHWLAIRHRFEEVRYIIWPDEKEVVSPSVDAQVKVSEMIDALFWLEAASTFCVRKVHPADVVDKKEFLPLNLRREVAVVARHVRNDPTIFIASPNALELFVTCAALCSNHGVPFSLFFPTEDVKEDDGSCIFANLPSVYTALGAIRIMSLLGGVTNAYVFSNAAGTVEREDVMRGLLRLMSVEAFGEKDALENVGEEELCTVMRFCVEVKEQNVGFFLRDITDEGEMSFMARYRQLSHIVLARCRHLLYRLNGPRTQVISEDAYIPFVDMQQHAERTNKDALIHYNLGIRSAQGLRRVSLGAQSSAQLAELVDRFEVGSTRVSGNTLLIDLVHHLSHKAAASKVSLTLKEVNIVLPLLARMRRETFPGTLSTRFDQLIASIETTIGIAMQQDCIVEELVSLVEGLAACNFLPSSFKQVEMVLLRLMMNQSCNLSQVTRILTALSSLLGSKVSQVLLQSAASHATACAKSTTITTTDTDQLVGLLGALESCKYAALPGLIVLCWEAYPSNNIQLSAHRRCNYASLLASAALVLQRENESLSQLMLDDSRQHFIKYVQNAPEVDMDQFLNCVTGLASVGFGRATENEVIRSALVTYLRSPCLTAEWCAAVPTTVLATLLESVLFWCTTLEVPHIDIIPLLERGLQDRLSSSGDSGQTMSGFSDELSEAACCVVGLQQISHELRRVAAEVLGRAILRAEAAVDAWKQMAQQDRSFEVVALNNAERESDHVNSVLRYCAALQKSGMAQYVEESVL